MPSQDMTRDEIEKCRERDIAPIETYCYMRALRGEGPGRRHPRHLQRLVDQGRCGARARSRR